MSAYEIREWRAEDAEPWLACQRACFSDERAKTRAEWAYLFHGGDHGLQAEAPGTRGVLAIQGDQVLAACVGMPSRTWFDGQERTCVHWVDLMVHPAQRTGLAGQRLHTEVAQAFFARYGEAAGDLMHHGWPIASARRFGERFLGYQLVREELCLLREVPELLPPADPAVLRLRAEDLVQWEEELRWLWERCAGEWGLSAIRDAQWMRARFLEHPSVNYRLLAVRTDGILRAVAVVRETPWHWPGALALCDWLVPSEEHAVAAQLEGAVQQTARELGLDRVVTLVPPFAGAFHWFQGQGWRVHPTPYHWLIRSFDRRLDPAWIHRHGWFTLADSDLA